MAPSEVENMFSVRENVWHGIGQILPDYPRSVDEILTAAGLDWTVEELPVSVTFPDGTVVAADDKKGVGRAIDHSLLSIMSGAYQPIQPRALAEFALGLLDVSQSEFEQADGQPPILFETGLSLSEGRVNVLLTRVPKDIRIGGEDPIELYLAFVTSHDGSLRFGVHATPVRVVCRNTLNLSFKQAVQQWSVRHTAGAINSIDEARKTLKLTWHYADEFTAQMNELLDQEYTKRQFEGMVTALFPKAASERAPFSREQYAMIGLLESSPTIDDSIRYTRYGALNAVREFDDWGRRFNDGGPPIAEKRTMATMFGKAKANSDKVFAYLTR
jgi:phage/plasmid-like protein (TIGR03299 family)